MANLPPLNQINGYLLAPTVRLDAKRSPLIVAPGCSPGWTMGADGICQRDASNFGGRGAGVGAQAGG